MEISAFDFTLWYVLLGVLLLMMALATTVVARLWITTSLLYLAIGIALGPGGAGLLDIDPVNRSLWLERLTEVAVIVSLFTAGLKLRVPWRDQLWRAPVMLASVGMAATVGMIALAGVVGLGLSLGAAILLGAILAPTDPVLASDVQVRDAGDRDRLRFTLTGEAGLNDGSAFPFVMLGLGLLGLHGLGDFGWRWVAVDLVWAVIGGLAIGAGLGTAIGYLVIHLRQSRGAAVGTDDLLTLGLIALAYGAALLFHTYGFLAVFAAGSALRRVERLAGVDEQPPAVEDAALEHAPEEMATHPDLAPAYLAKSLLGFNESLERIGEVAVVLVVGSLLTPGLFTGHALWFIPLLLLVIRPAATALVCLVVAVPRHERRLIGWFGIRGIGSIYYLMYAIEHDVAKGLGRQLIDLTLATVAVSIVVHGVSVTPLMARYRRRER